MLKASIAPFNYYKDLENIRKLLSEKKIESTFKIEHSIQGFRIDIVELNKEENPIFFYGTDLILADNKSPERISKMFSIMIQIQELLRIPGMLITSSSQSQISYDLLKDKCLQLGFGFARYTAKEKLEFILEPNLVIKFEERLGIVTNIEKVIDESVKNIENITRRGEVTVSKNDFEPLKTDLLDVKNSVEEIKNDQKQYEEKIRILVNSAIIDFGEPSILDWKSMEKRITKLEDYTFFLRSSKIIIGFVLVIILTGLSGWILLILQILGL